MASLVRQTNGLTAQAHRPWRRGFARNRHFPRWYSSGRLRQECLAGLQGAADALVLIDPDGLTAHHGHVVGVNPGPEVGENLHAVAGQHALGPYIQSANRPHRASVPRSEQGTLKAAQQLFNRSGVMAELSVGWDVIPLQYNIPATRVTVRLFKRLRLPCYA